MSATAENVKTATVTAEPLALFTKAKMVELKDKYKELLVLDIVSTPEEYKRVKEAAKVMQQFRKGIEDERVIQNEAALQHQRNCNAEARMVQEWIAEVEAPLVELKKAEDQRLKDIKEAEIQAEMDRKQALQDRLADIKAWGEELTFLSQADITKRMEGVHEIIVDESFEEMQREAANIKETVVLNLESAMIVRKEQDKKLAEQKAEAERLAKQQAEQADAQKVLDAERAEFEKERAEGKVAMAEAEAAKNAIMLAEFARLQLLAEEKHQAALLPDKEKLESFAANLLSLFDDLRPECDDTIARELVGEARNKLVNICNFINKKSAEL